VQHAEDAQKREHDRHDRQPCLGQEQGERHDDELLKEDFEGLRHQVAVVHPQVELLRVARDQRIRPTEKPGDFCMEVRVRAMARESVTSGAAVISLIIGSSLGQWRTTTGIENERNRADVSAGFSM
jgi:hypothetical protein